MEITIDSPEELRLRTELESRHDAESERIKRYLAMPDLSRTQGSPLYEIVEKAMSTNVLKDFDNIIIPEIVPTDISFDLFDFAPDHPARSGSDTYYVDSKHILRTHDTVMWYYYMQDPRIKERMKNKEKFGVVCHGKVYRKDEIDRNHMNVFHQFGGWYLAPSDTDLLNIEDLKNALSEIVKSIFGPDINYKFLPDEFPYTDPSLQIEVEVGGRWIEILGGGMTKQSVFKKFGVEGYNAWAFGFGLERLAIISMDLPDIRLLWSEDERVKKQLKLGHKYQEVSKFPPVVRDISFIVPASFVPNDYFDRIREVGGDLIEQVQLTDKYDAKSSYTFRITYRSIERTLTNEEVNLLHKKIEDMTEQDFQAQIRRE